jgi:hypothetical protein
MYIRRLDHVYISHVILTPTLPPMIRFFFVFSAMLGKRRPSGDCGARGGKRHLSEEVARQLEALSLWCVDSNLFYRGLGFMWFRFIWCG